MTYLALSLQMSFEHSFLIKATSPSQVYICSKNCVLWLLSYLSKPQSMLTSTSTWQLYVHFKINIKKQTAKGRESAGKIK